MGELIEIGDILEILIESYVMGLLNGDYISFLVVQRRKFDLTLSVLIRLYSSLLECPK